MVLLLLIINGIAFIFYGFLCLFTNHMKEEFERYELVRFRSITGFLEVCGGLGCLVGYFYSDLLYYLSCIGLGILMTMGTFVRFKMRDPLIDTLPAIFLGCINFFLIYIKLVSRGVL